MYSTAERQATYYPHIDGLRTFAVLSVLFFHVFPEWCSGGFIGVDVFFVISGYLITKGLYKDLERGTYSISNFYVRRIRRIFPAYAGMILFSVIMGWLIYDAESMKVLVKSVLSSIVFCSNIFFQRNSGYFDANIQDNPLLNMWSLSVEEQFYVFFPLMLAFLFKYARNRHRTILWGIAWASMGIGTILLLLNFQATAVFYGLPFRAWELLAGSLLAGVGMKKSRKHNWVGLTSLVLLCSLFFLYSGETVFPGATAILPVACAYFLIREGQYGASRVILEHPLTVFIGKISYSLYLFHWPILVFARYLCEGIVPSVILGWSVIVLSFIAAILSWKFVETPIRQTQWQPKKYFVGTALGAVTLAIITFGAYKYSNIASFCEVEPYWNGPQSSYCLDPKFDESENPTPWSLVSLGKNEKPQYIFWGDSHARALAVGFHQWSLETGINGIYINRKHWLVYKGAGVSYPKNGEWVDEVLSWIDLHPEIHNIVLINRWAVRTQGFTNENPVSFFDLSVEGVDDDESNLVKFTKGLSDLCAVLKEKGKNVIICSSIPELGLNVPSLAVKKRWFGGYANDLCITADKYNQRQKEAKEVLRDLEKHGLAKVIWVDSVFFSQNGNMRPLIENGKSLYIDDDHLSTTGANILIQGVKKELLESMVLRKDPKGE